MNSNPNLSSLVSAPEFTPDWESLKQYGVPRWLQDGKLGIFIHWGVYSVQQEYSEWYARWMYQEGHPQWEYHRKTYGEHTKFGYKDLIPLFKGEKFNATEWMDLFDKAGARYVVPVAEHHDGFAMYPTQYNRWNAMEMGPKRDIIGELSQAAADYHMIFGVSSHRAEHWWFMDGGMNFPSDVQDPRYRDFYGPAQPKDTQPSEAYLEDWYLRTVELIDKYQPQVLWFDWWIYMEAFRPYLKKLAAYYYNKSREWGRGVAFNYKQGAMPDGAGIFDVERGSIDDIYPYFWQNDTSVSRNSWSYSVNSIYKTPIEILSVFVDVISKNGALLLNIGPKPDGSICQEERTVLLEVGKWMRRNAEAVYDTCPWKIYGEGPTPTAEGQFNENKQKELCHKDLRFTTREGILYAFVPAESPNSYVDIISLGKNMPLFQDQIKAVSLLGYPGKIKWSHGEKQLRLYIPEDVGFSAPYAFKITGEKVAKNFWGNEI